MGPFQVGLSLVVDVVFGPEEILWDPLWGTSRTHLGIDCGEIRLQAVRCSVAVGFTETYAELVGV